jgi:uncharacterized membrane protein (UPF0127 family)
VACTTARHPTPPAAVFPSGAEFRLEIADDFEARQRGYMFREHVGEREGMLFLFERRGRHSIWMKNCRVGLDIIWLNDDGRVVEIAHDRQPCPAAGPCPGVFPMRAADYVLEVAAGTARREGLRRDDFVTLYLEEPGPS